jgi:hypothetical protein
MAAVDSAQEIRVRASGVARGGANQTLQQTAAAMLGSRRLLSLSAAAAAELMRSAAEGRLC